MVTLPPPAARLLFHVARLAARTGAVEIACNTSGSRLDIIAPAGNEEILVSFSASLPSPGGSGHDESWTVVVDPASLSRALEPVQHGPGTVRLDHDGGAVVIPFDKGSRVPSSASWPRRHGWQVAGCPKT